MVKNMQGLSRKTSTQSFHHHMNSPPPTFDFPLHLKENVEEERRKAAYADYLRQLELVHEQSKQCLRIEQQKLDSMLQSATQHAQSSSYLPVSERAAPIMATSDNVETYAKPFCDFLTNNPTVFHAVDDMAQGLKHDGFTKLSERDSWRIEAGGKYFVERNGSSLIAFVVGDDYKSGNGAAVLAGHVDALTAKLKPVSKVPNKAGYVELGVAPYAGGLGPTWWDRDLSIGGRVLVREGNKIVTKLVKLGWPIAKIPTLAPHFGAPANGPFNLETQVVPIIGLESSAKSQIETQGKVGSFAATQPPRLVRAIAKELGVSDASSIVNWELELFDLQPATLAGLDKEFITAGRIDDKLCSWAALEALKQSARHGTSGSGIIKMVGLFDDEEIGSGLRQGARGNFLPIVMERAVGSLAGQHPASDLMGRTYANSFLVSSDVTHAVNPNFENVYLANHAPELNVGVVVSADSNGHMTTDGVSTAIFTRCAEKVNATLQVFQIRNDSRSGGTVGPMLSCATGMRAIDAGIPQLSMHSIRATTGTSDPGLGVQMFQGFLDGFESVDAEFRD
ncbi:peptidase M18, aminopeptidase I [Aureobasidium subglaciale]|nr:peptidase M18, aminopeptidase I [Aureobasidium subglaciale]